MDLTPRDRERYHRQMLLPRWGEEGQRALRKATVLVAGAGGLGSPVSIYLAVAGVGCIRVVDRDVPELSNLNRQILHGDGDVGRPKVSSAADTLAHLNPDVCVEAIQDTISEENVLDLTRDVDIIVDCMDNYAARFLLNRAAMKRRIPFVHGAVWGLEGRVTTIMPGQSPCLRCIVPTSPSPEIFPVVGATPGVIGCIQATEALKYLTGIGELLTGRLLLYDGEGMEFSEVHLRRDPSCPACSSQSTGAGPDEGL